MTGSDSEAVEPNMMPLLDLVLQLLMFFLIVANFVQEQVNQKISLPTATTAVPIDKTIKNVLLINVDEDGNVAVPDSYAGNLDGYMADQYAFAKRDRPETVKDMAVVVRADQKTTCDKVYKVMRSAKAAGFANVQLRANRPAPGS